MRKHVVLPYDRNLFYAESHRPRQGKGFYVKPPSGDPDIGENRSSMPIQISGDSIEVSFNYKYIIDGLANIKGSEVMFDVSKEEGPCILRPVGDGSYMYVVMPIKSMQ